MPKASDYLMAAAVSLMRNADNSALETSQNIKSAIEERFPAHLDDQRLAYLCHLLESYGFISVTEDAYAGSYITPISGWAVSYRINKIKEVNPAHGLVYALDGGARLFEKAFSNPSFWGDLDQEIKDAATAVDEQVKPVADEVPTSDGFVSLSHNQFKEIDEPTGTLLEKLEADNGIPDHPGLKERLMGQIKAGRELLRAGEFQLGVFKSTMVSGLQELTARYGDHAIGLASSALLTIILHVLGIPGF